MKPATSDLSCTWSLPRPIIKYHQKKNVGFAEAHHKFAPREKVGGLGPGELPKILGSPIIFLQRLKLATSNLARSWGLSSTVIKSHAEENGALPWTSELPKIWRLPFNIYATVEASDFKFGIQLGFAKAHHKIAYRKNWVWPWARGAPKNYGVSL